jgi:hypothetical protein
MRENRLSGSEGGGAETNQSFLPLSQMWPFTLPSSPLTQNFDGHPVALPQANVPAPRRVKKNFPPVSTFASELRPSH